MRLSALSKTTPGSNFCSLYSSVSMVYADKASGCATQQENLLSLAGYFPPVRALILRSVKEELACTRARSLMAASVAASDSTRSTPHRKGDLRCQLRSQRRLVKCSSRSCGMLDFGG